MPRSTSTVKTTAAMFALAVVGGDLVDRRLRGLRRSRRRCGLEEVGARGRGRTRDPSACACTSIATIRSRSITDAIYTTACRSAPRPRSAPTTSAACCGRTGCSRRARTTRPATHRRAELRAGRGRGDPRGRALQEEVGLQTVTDGEFRRASWHMDFIYEIGGVSKAPDNLTSSSTTPRATSSSRPAALHGRRQARRSQTIFGEDFALPAVAVASRAPPEAHDPLAEHGPLPRRPRGDRRDRLSRHRRLLGRPRRASTPRRCGGSRELGCTYLQLDDTSLAYLNDPTQREMTSRRGRDAEHLHEAYIRHINEALAGPAGGHDGDDAHVPRQFPLVVGGRGRLRPRRRGAVQRARRRRLLPGVRRRALGRLRAAALRAEGQAGRARPRDDQARRRSRPRTTLKRRIDEAAQYVDVDQLCLSPQCGFSSTVEGNALTRRRGGGQARARRRDRATRCGASLPATRCAPSSRRAAGSSRARTSA